MSLSRAAVLLFVLACSAPAQFLEFHIKFDDGGCLSCAESLESRMQRVRGVEEVELDLDNGVVHLRLAADNRVRLMPLMSRIEQGAAKALETRLRVKGLVAEGNIELQGAASGQVYSLEGDTSGASGLVVVEAQLVDAAAGRLRVVSIEPAE